MSLLSPSESKAFQSFLSTMDYADDAISASDWAMYNSNVAIHQVSDDDPLVENGVNPGQREALAKATKDLMSLDSDMWDTSTSSSIDHQPNVPHQALDMQGRHNGHYNHQLLTHQQQVLQHQHQQNQQRHNSFSTNRDVFPFLHSKVQQQSMPPQYPTPTSHIQQQHAQINSLNHSSATTSPGFQQRPPLHHQHQRPSQPQQVHIPQQRQQSQQGVSPVSRSTRLSGSGSAPSSSGSSRTSTSAPNGRDASTSSASTRNNTADASGTSKRTRTSASPPIVNRPGQPQQKSALLSPSQKKANHIQSEQKRRANIRRGYEALCETVPALREAIREEEEQERVLNGGGASRKKTRAKKGAKDGDERERDRLDGRAGPRSENVVLSQSEFPFRVAW